MPEPALVVGLHLRRGVVALARQRARRLHVAEPDARRADRKHRDGDAVLVHRLDGVARLPRCQPVVEGVGGALENFAGLLDIDRRIGVVVRVDAVRDHGSLVGTRGNGD